LRAEHERLNAERAQLRHTNLRLRIEHYKLLARKAKLSSPIELLLK